MSDFEREIATGPINKASAFVELFKLLGKSDFQHSLTPLGNAVLIDELRTLILPDYEAGIDSGAFVVRLKVDGPAMGRHGVDFLPEWVALEYGYWINEEGGLQYHAQGFDDSTGELEAFDYKNLPVIDVEWDDLNFANGLALSISDNVADLPNFN